MPAWKSHCIPWAQGLWMGTQWWQAEGKVQRAKDRLPVRGGQTSDGMERNMHREVMYVCQHRVTDRH